MESAVYGTHNIVIIIHIPTYIVLVALDVALLIYKKSVFYYPLGLFIAEFLALFVIFSPIELLRIMTIFYSNLTKNTRIFIVAAFLALLSTFGSLYYIIWQTYILGADFLVNLTHLSLVALECFLGFIAIFCKQH